MTAHTVIRLHLDDDDQVPADPPRDGILRTVDWFAEQHLGSPAWVHSLEVVEEDDGHLTAYIERFDTHLRRSGVEGPFMDSHGYASRHLEHHPVTSVRTLLDQFDTAGPEEPVVPR